MAFQVYNMNVDDVYETQVEIFWYILPLRLRCNFTHFMRLGPFAARPGNPLDWA